MRSVGGLSPGDFTKRGEWGLTWQPELRPFAAGVDVCHAAHRAERICMSESKTRELVFSSDRLFLL